MGVTPEFVDAARTGLGANVKRTYGSTEAPTITTSTRGRWSRSGPRHRRSFGGRWSDPGGRPRTPIGHGRRVSPARCCCGVPSCSWATARRSQTRRAVRRGWFATGDLGVLDDEGWLTIVGRLKDVIIRSGENIAAAEVERVLETHPFVRQAVAVGCPDDRVGERVAAFVVGDHRLDVEECRRWFAAQGVARFKTPELVMHLDAIPLLGLGKPDRAALRTQAAAGSRGERRPSNRRESREEHGRMTTGIVAWGAYLPYWRLERAAIGAAFGTPAARGQRAVASYDEDTTTLGVEAARRALRAEAVPDPAELFFSTPDPAYMDKTNATTVHAALGLEPTVGAYDVCGSVRSAWGAMRAAALAGRAAADLGRCLGSADGPGRRGRGEPSGRRSGRLCCSRPTGEWPRR